MSNAWPGVDPLAFPCPDQRPDDPRHAVGECHCDDPHRLILQHAPMRVVPRSAAPPCSDLRHGTEIEQLPEVWVFRPLSRTDRVRGLILGVPAKTLLSTAQ